MLKKYDGISIGTIQRRRRAPVEKFLNLQVDLPSIEEQKLFSKFAATIQNEKALLRDVQNKVADMLSFFGNYWLKSL
jgi:hypothetical protein